MFVCAGTCREKCRILTKIHGITLQTKSNGKSEVISQRGEPCMPTRRQEAAHAEKCWPLPIWATLAIRALVEGQSSPLGVRAGTSIVIPALIPGMYR